MRITLEQLNNSIKKIFDNTKVQSIDTVYEKITNSTNLKLVIFLHNIYYDKTNIIYTKFIFIVDKNKEYLINNNVLYLFDINDVYKTINFEDIPNFESKINNIFNKKTFGNDIINLSNFLSSPVTILNNWLANNDITNISVYSFKYEPLSKIMPSKSLFFNFEMNLDDKYTINVILTKLKNNEYSVIIKNYETKEEYVIKNLNELIQEIGGFIKIKIKV
jgi:hypothetical protein